MSYQRYVAIGDSTTEGLEDPYPPHAHLYERHGHSLSPSHPEVAGSYRGWADRLAVHIADAQAEPLEYANLAIRGHRLADIRATQLDAALAMRPDVMTIVGGVNDASKISWDAHAVRGHIGYLFGKATRSGAVVLTFTMPDPAAINWLVRPLRRNIHELNEITREEAARFGVRVLDVAAHPVGVDPRLWHADRLHGTSLGHQRIALGLAYTLGLPGFDESWARPLPPADLGTWWQRRAGDRAWLRDYFIPFVRRHRRGESMGDGRTAKRPLPTVVGPEMSPETHTG
ncbi:SGNH/GDSL hydrolase family protein [Cumulibacter manganitolerans]|uniref:SGNH/GDSL hydrolase family protein n=1 Tax=Cumulibacter manganitolerans TaxID=1884992 RepID=UPI001297EED0|nr:SGNH/GDSL hydrolase family protein [Cumulibacter manganitolerans]